MSAPTPSPISPAMPTRLHLDHPHQSSSSPVDIISAAQARRLLLTAQGLMGGQSPAGKVDADRVLALIERLGFVQVDSINVVERAHHLILAARLDHYRHDHLRHLLEESRTVFEHWTHDASIIPVRWFPMWRHRFRRYETLSHKWWKERLGPKAAAVRHQVLARIEREGALRSRDFLEDPDKGGHRKNGSQPWWGWKPDKAALEWLWRTGDLAIARRENFQKVYDLTGRVYPREWALPVPEQTEHIAWACESALERLIIATPGEIAGFFNAVTISQATHWSQRAVKDGFIVPVRVEHEQDAPGNGSKTAGGHNAFALHDWRQRLGACDSGRGTRRARILCPFDPVIRDRKRLRRLFGFDYAFEGFTVAGKRKFGYYVLPVLDGATFIARMDAKFDRAQGILKINTLWWEPKVKVSQALKDRLDAALARTARTIGADRFVIQRTRTNGDQI